MLDAIQRSLRITGFYFAGDLHENDIKLSDKDYQNTRRAALLVSKIYSPYFLRQEPIWGTENIDMCLNNHKYDRIDMSVEKFNWLMNQYVENELKTVLSRK